MKRLERHDAGETNRLASFYDSKVAEPTLGVVQ